MAEEDSQSLENRLVSQAANLFDIHKNISRVIEDLSLPFEEVHDAYNITTSDAFEFESMVRLYLYKEVAELSQKQLSERIETWPYLQLRFGFDRPPIQQAISYTIRNRFSADFRRLLNRVADGIRSAGEQHGVQTHAANSPDVNPSPDEIAESSQPLYQYVDERAPEVIESMLNDVAPALDTGRSHNVVHEDETVWEHQLLMSLMDTAGTRSAHRSFNKFRENALHHDTHVRAVKKLGTPSGCQYTFDDYPTGADEKRPVPDWRRVADTVQDQFGDAVDRMLDTVASGEMFSEPVAAAIDVTNVPYHVTPWKGDADVVSDDEEPIMVHGNPKYPKENYPEMVNGGEEDEAYEYQYATLTIVGQNAPLVIAVEPIRHKSRWERGGESVSWAEVVDRLMAQATELVDIHLVMADRAFDQHGVFHVLDQYYDVDYLIPKKKNSERLRRDAADVRNDPAVTARVEQDAALYLRDSTPYIDPEADETVGENGYSHDVMLMHVPAQRNDWIVRHEDDTGYALFVTNRNDVSPLDAEGLVNRYSDRWDIEIEYKMITPLVPSIASTDYRMRFFSFAFSCLLYNLWRLVDHSLKVLAAEKFDGYGRGTYEERLDPVLPQADFLASSMVLLFRAGLDPPDVTT